MKGVYVGRFGPLHLGHQRVIDFMLQECGYENSLLLIGSSNHVLSYRHLFSLSDRRAFLNVGYPALVTAGLPDYPTDADWLEDMWSIIRLRWPQREEDVTFFGGCEEDILFFVAAGYPTRILNRFDGSGPKVSATEVRDALVHNRSTEGLLHPRVEGIVRARFTQRWQELKNT